MPPLPNVPNVLRLEIGTSIGPDPSAFTRLHYLYTDGPPAAADLEAFNAMLKTSWDGNVRGLMNTYTSLLSFKLTDLTTTSSAQYESAYSDPGERSGGQVPAGSNVLCNYEITRRYRGGKPKSFLPLGVAGDISDEQDWGASFIASVASQWDTFINHLAGQTSGTTTIVGLVSVSYYEGFTSVQNPVTMRWRNIPKLRTGGPVIDVVNSIVVPQRIASQRRRN